MPSVQIKDVPEETHAVLRQRSPSQLCGKTMLVVDASVLVVALVDDGPDGDRVRQRLRGEQLAAPELIDLEVGSVLRSQNRAGQHFSFYDAVCVALAEVQQVTLLRNSRSPHRE